MTRMIDIVYNYFVIENNYIMLSHLIDAGHHV